jgi:hypothetical protein
MDWRLGWSQSWYGPEARAVVLNVLEFLSLELANKTVITV